MMRQLFLLHHLEGTCQYLRKHIYVMSCVYVMHVCVLPEVLWISPLESSIFLRTYAVIARIFFNKIHFFMTFVYYYYDLLPPMSYPLTHFWSFSFFAPLQLLAFICVLYVIFLVAEICYTYLLPRQNSACFLKSFDF